MDRMDELSRRDVLKAILALGVAAVTRTVGGASAQPDTGPGNIDEFFRDFAADWVRHDPSFATATRYFRGDEQDRLERHITPTRALDWRQDRIRRAREGLTRLHRFDRRTMTDLQRVSADVMDWQLDTIVREEPYLNYTFPLEQFNGANVNLVEGMTVRRPMVTERDAENYVAALAEVAPRMNEAVDEVRRLESKGIIPPRFILAATIKQMQAFVDTAPAQSPFVASLRDRMSTIKEMTDSRREQLRGEAEKIVVSEIYPAWKSGIAALTSQLARASDQAGLWRFKGGADIYAAALARFTTTKLTASEIHELGLRQVERIESEMDGLFRRLNRTGGSVKDRVAKLKLDLQYPNPLSEESRAQIMRDLDVIIRDAERRAAVLFDLRPKSPVVVQPFPTFREGNAAANYSAPSLDGSRPGTFQFPRRIQYMTRFAMRSIVYHETVPGHHFQIALQVENTALPRFRQVGVFGGMSAAVEGWGLYAERLAAEAGWYGEDLEGRLGQLDDELFRARRLVIDTGLHAKKWSRQQAIDFGIEASEIERYVVNPGQACSYMVGELRIIELRDKARKALGDRFSLREFHNAVLAVGAVPLDVLAQTVDRYVKSASQRKTGR